MKEIMKRKLSKKLTLYILLLIVVQIGLVVGVSKISQGKGTKISANDEIAEAVTEEDIAGLNVIYPKYTEGDIIYFDPVTTKRCAEDTFSETKIINGSSTCYKWRVLNTDDASTKGYISIQLDHNYGGKVDWVSSADKTEIINNNSERNVDNTTAASIGPISALKMVQSSTSSWVRVPLLNYEYDTSDVVKPNSEFETNYGKLTCINGECKNGKGEILVQNTRARLVTPQELSKIAKKHFSDQDVSGYSRKNLADWEPGDYEIAFYPFSNGQNESIIWLMENLTNNSTRGWTLYGGSSASGYWTLAPTSFSPSLAWNVSDNQELFSGIATTYNSSIGVRPVIEYSKLNTAHLVTYDDEGRITKKVVFDGDKTEEIDSKGKQGYKFAYWSLKKDGKKAFDFNTKITSNITLYAVYSKMGCTVENQATAVDYIEDLYIENPNVNNLIYDETADNNLRYYNSNPNNYIRFNGELWRIVGVFNTEDASGNKTKRLKIVRNESIGRYSWDSTYHGISAAGNGNQNNASGINEWSQADLMYLLNPGYDDHKEPRYYNDTNNQITYDEEDLVNNSLYYNSASGKCFVGYNNYSTNCDFTNTGIKESSKQYIDTVKWNTGAVNVQPSTITVYDLYNIERGNATGKDEITKSDYSYLDDVDRTTTWVGQVGLLYPSDTILSAGDFPNADSLNREFCLSSTLNGSLGACTTSNNWLFNSGEQTWSITPTNGLSLSTTKKPSYVLGLSGASYYSYNTEAAQEHPVKPALYLKPNVSIKSGSGTESDPYEIDFADEQVCTVDVTYNDEGRITKKTIAAGAKAEKIAAKGKEDHTFKYWSKDKTNEFNFNTVLNDDITLYAVYEKNAKEETVDKITSKKEIKTTKKAKKSSNPKTSDNIKLYIISLIISTIVLEITLKKYIKNKVRG